MISENGCQIILDISYLGFGILAVVLILFFGVRFISSKFGNQKTTEPKQETQQETETPTPTQEAEETPATTAEPETTPAAGELELNAYPQVNALIEKYYAALTGKDVQSLKELVDELDPSDESAITNSQYIESYSNVQVYTKKGMTDTSYMYLFAAYDHKYVVMIPFFQESVICMWIQKRWKFVHCKQI